MHNLFVITTADREDPGFKCCIVWHFINVYTVCKDINHLQKKKLQFYLEIVTCDSLNYTMTIPSLLHQSRKKNSID